MCSLVRKDLFIFVIFLFPNENNKKNKQSEKKKNLLVGHEGWLLGQAMSRR
jgi:hypothetical protein